MTRGRKPVLLRVFIALALVVVSSARAETGQVRLLLSIGSNYGHPDEAVLQFAEADATRVRDLFVDLGDVERGRATVLARPTAQRIREQFAEVKGRVNELHAAGKRVQLIVFASGHGKDGALHLVGGDLPLGDVRSLANDTGAELRLLVVDACDAGPIRQKGARKGPAYSVAVAPPALEGEAFIASSGAEESAQEWDVLGGSLFTHHLLTGLRGDADADGDGKVTLMEAYAYASRRTVAESIDVGQHPEFDVGLKGVADLVLTTPSKSSAQLWLDDALEGRFVVVSQPRPDVIAELTKPKGRPLKIAVPPGRYLIRQTRGYRVALQEVELPYGGTERVDGTKFVTRDYAEVAMKGGEPSFSANALEVLVDGATAPLDGTPGRLMGFIGYRLAVGDYWARVSAGAGRSSYRAVGLTTSELRFSARVSGGGRLWLGPVILMPGLVLEASQLRQSYVRDNEAAIARAYGPVPERRVLGGAVGPILAVEAKLPGPFFATAAVTALVRELPAMNQPTWTVGGDAEIGAGIRW